MHGVNYCSFEGATFLGDACLRLCKRAFKSYMCAVAHQLSCVEKNLQKQLPKIIYNYEKFLSLARLQELYSAHLFMQLPSAVPSGFCWRSCCSSYKGSDNLQGQTSAPFPGRMGSLYSVEGPSLHTSHLVCWRCKDIPKSTGSSQRSQRQRPHQLVA